MNEVKHVPTTTFTISGLSSFNAEVVERLRQPTIKTGEWHTLITPEFMHGQVNDEILDGGELEASYRKTYQDKVQLRPELKAPYTRLVKGDEDWQTQPMVDVPIVKEAIDKVVETLPETIRWIEKHPEGQYHKSLVQYLESNYDLLPKGEFNKLMVKFLEYDPAEDVRVQWLPVESREDPMGDRTVPQGFLAVVDREMTDQANIDQGRYRRSAIHHFGYAPYDAWLFVTNTAATSGALATANSPKSGFNVPNYQPVAEEAGHNVIYEMLNSLGELNRDFLSPAFLAIIGKESSAQDVGEYTLGHEVGHGDGRDGEEGYLGWMKTAAREGWAANWAIVATDYRDFSTEKLHRVVRGKLAFDSDDSARFRSQLFNNYGINQPTLDELLGSSGYAVEAYISLRMAFLEKAIHHKFGEINYDVIVRQAYEREKFYRQLVKSSNPDIAYHDLAHYFREEVEEKRSWSLSNLAQRLFGRKESQSSSGARQTAA